MSWKDALSTGSAKALTALGASSESAEYVKLRMKELLEIAETRLTGVPQTKDVENMWFQAYELKLRQAELTKKVFAQEATANGSKYISDEKYKEEVTKLEKLKAALKAAKEAHEAAVKSATEAQEILLTAWKSSPN